jgi:hypothetical protein
MGGATGKFLETPPYFFVWGVERGGIGNDLKFRIRFHIMYGKVWDWGTIYRALTVWDMLARTNAVRTCKLATAH